MRNLFKRRGPQQDRQDVPVEELDQLTVVLDWVEYGHRRAEVVHVMASNRIFALETARMQAATTHRRATDEFRGLRDGELLEAAIQALTHVATFSGWQKRIDS
jgi:hypothetical protein